MATEEAQNAFLKTFEEPPEYAYIFLITPYIDRLLKTVLSRAQIIENPKSQITNPKRIPNYNFKLQNLLKMNIGERFLWLEEILKGLEDKSELRRTLITLVDQFLFKGVELAKKGECPIEALHSLKEAKWKIEQGFPNPRLLVENFFLTLKEK